MCNLYRKCWKDINEKNLYGVLTGGTYCIRDPAPPVNVPDWVKKLRRYARRNTPVQMMTGDAL